MSWHAHRLCALDFESTDKDPEKARIVTACIAFVGGGEPTEVMSWVADAGVEVPAEAAAIHGYTTERVRAEGKPLADVLPEIVGTLTAAIAAHVPIVIYNAPYDATLLDRETRRFGLPPFVDVLADAHVIDPLCIDRAVDRYRKGKRTLTAACEHYGARLDGAHDSTFDALAAARVAWHIAQRSHMTTADLVAHYADRRYPERVARDVQALAALTLPELHASQVRWYAEQSESLGQYWRQQANEARHRADHTEDDGERAIALQEAAELDARVDSLCDEWPIQTTKEATR